MVFHRKCQFYVGDTCFPGPHLSYFQSPSPAQSVPNLKLLSNGKPPGSSRPNSRASQITLEDRSRSVTPSQAAPRASPTPPVGFFSKRDSAAEKAEQRRMMSSPPPSSYRAMSPDGYPQTLDNGMQGQDYTQGARPSSRQSDNSPTSPTFSGLRNLMSRPRRFSFSKKSSVASAAVPVAAQSSSSQHLLPTPPTSYTSSPSSIALSGNGGRSLAGTPDSNKSSLFSGYPNSSQQQRQRVQPPVTPPKSLPVPIAMGGGKSGSAGRAYRGREYLPGGPFDPLDDEVHSSVNNFGRGHQRPSSITLFSTSAPPVRSDYRINSSGNRSGRSSAASLSSSKYSREGRDSDDDGEDDEVDQDDHGEIGEMNEEDLEALLIPSVVRTPRSSIDAGKPVAGAGYNRVKSPSIGQTLSQQQQHHQDATKPPSAISFNPSSMTGRATTPQQQQQPLYHPGRPQLNNGYHSSGSSSAAMTSSYSSHSNNSSSVSSLGSVAALIEEEERQLKEFQQQQRHYGSGSSSLQQRNGANNYITNNNNSNKMLDVPSGYQLGGTQSSQSHHVGIRTMLSRFSNTSRDTTITNNNNNNNNNGISLLGSSLSQEKRESQQHLPVPTANKSSSAYATSSRYPIQALSESQQKQNQQPPPPQTHYHVPIGNHYQSSYGGGIPRKSSDSMMKSSIAATSAIGSGGLNDFDRNNMVNTSNSNSSNTHQYPTGRRRSGSVAVGGSDYQPLRPSSASASASAAAAAGAAAASIASSAAAASALRRGGKVTRRSVGATVETDCWD
ncbi:MAG: hypothetical protein J3R72DRAFT_172880 [Linnemannia gamsii]|nr:MAG: hypothetical protein J3R72DRAFT_172880 [Linnemannia gamsii]